MGGLNWRVNWAPLWRKGSVACKSRSIIFHWPPPFCRIFFCHSLILFSVKLQFYSSWHCFASFLHSFYQAKHPNSIGLWQHQCVFPLGLIENQKIYFISFGISQEVFLAQNKFILQNLLSLITSRCFLHRKEHGSSLHEVCFACRPSEVFVVPRSSYSGVWCLDQDMPL